jgi:hypothetical protein
VYGAPTEHDATLLAHQAERLTTLTRAVSCVLYAADAEHGRTTPRAGAIAATAFTLVLYTHLYQ